MSTQTAKTFVLRCGTQARDVLVSDWGLSIWGLSTLDKDLRLSCKIHRRAQGKWWEIDDGKMLFMDNNGNAYKGTLTDGWWTAIVPKSNIVPESIYWPHELREGTEQFVNSTDVEPRPVPSHYPWPEPEPEGVVTPFAVLGDEDDRPIEEVVEEFKGLVEEATEVKILPVLDEDGEPTGEEVGIAIPKSMDEKMYKEQPLEPEPERKPAWTRGMEKAAEKRQAIHVCPICGATTTKKGKLFKSALSVKRHIAAAHKTKSTE